MRKNVNARHIFPVLLFAVLVPSSVLAASVASVAFITPPQSIGVSVSSDVITVEMHDADGSPVNGTTVCVQVTSSSASGEFSTNADWSSDPVGTLLLTVSSNQYRRNFYYRDSTNGSYTLSVKAAPRPDGMTCPNWSPASGVSWSASQTLAVGSGQSVSGSQTQPETQNFASTPPPSSDTTLTIITPLITAHIETDTAVIVGAGSLFKAQAYGTQKELLQHARYIWNFGDGSTAEGQNVFHAYAYPGTYLVVLTAASGISSASERLAVTAAPARVRLTQENDGSLTVFNDSDSDLNVGYWMLSRGGASFVMPEGTIIAARGAVRFAPVILKLPAGMAGLQYQNGDVAAWEKSNPHAEGITYFSTAQSAAPPVAQPRTAKASAASITSDRVTESPAPQTLAAAVAEAPGPSVPLWGSVLALAALIVLGISAVLYARLPGTPALAEAAGTSEQSETARLAKEFQILDVTPGVEENIPPR